MFPQETQGASLAYAESRTHTGLATEEEDPNGEK
jgi:hypothetical protein